MLKFYDYNVTHSLEIPNEVCLNYHIAECQNRCDGCFSPELWESTDINLSDVYYDIMLAYSNRITCVCFLGDGKNTHKEHSELICLCNIIHEYGFKTALYCGRDCEIEEWMWCFDFVKVGAYNSKYGDLSFSTTNQRLYRKEDNRYLDITYLLWEIN